MTKLLLEEKAPTDPNFDTLISLRAGGMVSVQNVGSPEFLQQLIRDESSPIGTNRSSAH
jgi:hypothetical protein